MTTADLPTVPVEACPACHARMSRQVGRCAAGFDTWINGRNFRQPAYAVRCCEVCGLYFKSATLSAAALSEYYDVADATPFDYDGHFPTDRILSDRLAALPDGSRVLDFGCSSGRILKPHASRLRCAGVEPNVTAATVARARGITITTEDAVWQSQRTFDAVLLTDVYEHLIDPVPVVERLGRTLVAGGWMAIVTGNADAVRNHDDLAAFWYFRIPGHVAMLGERHLRWLAQRLDLRLARIHRCSHYDEPVHRRLKQHLQAFAYERFRKSPRGVAARVMRLIPRLRSAEHWPSAPAFGCGKDHVVAFFEHA